MGSQEAQDGAGVLVVAGVPMGNPGDATARLIAALGEADIIAAEDTRRARTLASQLGVELRGRVLSFYDHNEQGRIPQLLDEIAGGARVLLITDAGMPSVSDPGYRLVAAVVEAGHAVTCLPGPSAVTTALALSGLPVERFCFDGFAPRKSGARRTWLAELTTERRACVFFESPHRLAETLADAADVLGPDRRAAVCRELTKTYEEVRRGPLGELAAWAADGVRGEITVVIAGAAAVSTDPTDHLGAVLRRVEAGERLKDACAAVAAETGASKRELYEAALAAR
ncbi:16S rRNA (cytidine(1402)-2'-O)-methyltransferase [Tsukamurella strandjordii]|uniref:Ribosomal RNA small subunit methyltransferase I n=1 Tax=Tsukamurella strandjordii TaxID=147577 RepID=A0AA90NGB3_9ACTN|nr:16S rRNA (cytidine(1402)-2'-O)-methyltransferase [Tsukamurella strandjordii]MDP0397919.1 16S rRNA (cytidine(1402)-2'-O)-methyltransferase [Tsukamurella strandjordii]